MIAIRHDSPLRWRVPSKSRGKEIEHVVDLGWMNGNGKCSCEHFEFHLQPEIAQRLRDGMATRCNHILIEREAFINEVIQRINQNQKNDDN